MVIAAIGTPTTMLASMCLLVDMGMAWIMSMVLVIMSLLSVSAMVLCSQAGISESRLTRGLGPQPW